MTAALLQLRPTEAEAPRIRLSDETFARVLGIHIADATPARKEPPWLSFIALFCMWAVLFLLTMVWLG